MTRARPSRPDGRAVARRRPLPARAAARPRWRWRWRAPSQQGGALVVEAGTGVGKTFSYLVPGAAERRARAAVHRHQDAAGPAVRPRPAAAGRSAGLAGAHGLAQGPRQLPVPASHGAGAPGRRRCRTAASVRALAKIEEWSQVTRTGDLAELPGLDERSPLIPLVTSTRENCLGAQCPKFRSLPRQPGAARSAGGRRGGHQPPPVLRRPGGARVGHGRTAADRARGDLRRGAPAQRNRRAVPGRAARHRASCWISRATCWPPACSWRAAWSTGSSWCRRVERAARDLRLVVGKQRARCAAALGR